jgi:hypothetical protein
MTKAELQEKSKQLYKWHKRIALKKVLSSPEHNGTHCGFGVYALWEGKELLYIGYTRKNLKAPSASFSGIKNRLHSHRLGGGSFGQLLLMVKIARNFKEKDWDQIASGEVSMNEAVQQHVQSHVSYTFVETETAEDAKRLEKFLLESEERAPLLNMLRKRYAKASKFKPDGK